MLRKQFILVALVFWGFTFGLWAQNDALFFDGVNDCVAIGSMTSDITTQFTVEAWINPTTVAVGAGELATYGRTIFASSTANDKPIWVSLRGGEIWVCAFNGNNTVIKTTTLGLTADTWVHIAVSVIRGGAVVLYVNGLQVATGTAGTTGTTWNTIFTIGDLRPNRLLPFSGIMDEVRVWNVVRTPEQILGAYDTFVEPDTAGLVGYWKLDGDATDSTDNNYDGVVRNGLVENPNPTWVDGNPTLPIELSSFTAILTADYFVRLHWVTQSETGVSGFYIYRGTTNEISSAITVSPLIDATNSTEQHYYDFTDTELFEPGTYFYWLSVQNLDGSTNYHGPTTVYYDNTAVNQGAPGIPIISGLNSVYPNPFNPNTTINYGLAKDTSAAFTIYNSRGQIVRTINEGQKAAGNWKLNWNGTDDNGNICSTGIYFIKMQAGKDSFVRKAMLLK